MHDAAHENKRLIRKLMQSYKCSEKEAMRRVCELRMIQLGHPRRDWVDPWGIVTLTS